MASSSSTTTVPKKNRQGAILGALEGCDAVIHLAADGRRKASLVNVTSLKVYVLMTSQVLRVVKYSVLRLHIF